MGLIDRLSGKLRTAPTAEKPTAADADSGQTMSADMDMAAPPVWELLSSKSGSHLYFLNPDHVQAGLLDLIDRPPRHVLDVGCYCGATGETVKHRWPGAQVTGIEPLAEAAALAAPRIDRVITGTLESVDFAAACLEPGCFDTIILADVLEHMFDPWQALQRLRPLLSADGVILASIPNVRNLGLIHKLVSGYWTYEGGGLLDITHIRFFTLAEIRKMFSETGYEIATVEHNVDPALRQLWDIDAAQEKANVQVGALAIGDLSHADRKELATLQFYVRASRVE